MTSCHLINPFELPSVALSDREALPRSPGLYFVIDGNDVIAYIGKAEGGLKQRWLSHHRVIQFEEIVGARIAYYVSNKGIRKLEAQLIEELKPSLNNTVMPRKYRLQKPKDSSKRFSVRLPRWYYKRLAWSAAMRGQSISGLAERMIMNQIDADEALVERMVAEVAKDKGMSAEELKSRILERVEQDFD